MPKVRTGLGSFSVRSRTGPEPGEGIDVETYRRRFRPVNISTPPVSKVKAPAIEPGSISGACGLGRAQAAVLSAARIIPKPRAFPAQRTIRVARSVIIAQLSFLKRGNSRF